MRKWRGKNRDLLHILRRTSHGEHLQFNQPCLIMHMKYGGESPQAWSQSLRLSVTHVLRQPEMERKRSSVKKNLQAESWESTKPEHMNFSQTYRPRVPRTIEENQTEWNSRVSISPLCCSRCRNASTLHSGAGKHKGSGQESLNRNIQFWMWPAATLSSQSFCS